ncbi:hypothetical protein KDL01_07920 [Actinospica durhamensis]|uniref:Uncharacterized protein n=1 Tax=Actinospica durhamensis TaxID=1508375 RepID=A0A941IPJ2_9ACTN|nr:hypothetical protein [Actinospica durhamensis]MBR7833187.1 hypothetical protein [Actinospica durhamensis]
MSGTEPVEFLEPDEGEEVDWLEEDPLGAAPSRLTLTTRHRAAVSLLTLAALLAAGVGTADRVYRHDQALELAASALVLTQPAGAAGVSLPTIAVLGVGTSWTWRPDTDVQITLVNRGPDPVTLLPGDTLASLSQIDGVARLDPVGTATLQPGQTGRLEGVAVAQCNEDDPNALLTLTVRARTASGSVGLTSLELSHSATEGTLAEQACQAEAPKMAAWTPAASTDARAHTFTLSMSVTSQADVPLTLGSGQEYYNVYPAGTFMGSDVSPSLPGIVLDAPIYSGDESDTAQLAPGRRLTASYTVHVARCPATGPIPDQGWKVELFTQLSVDASFASTRQYTVDLSSLVAAACGLPD